jgi:hypothetical protein
MRGEAEASSPIPRRDILAAFSSPVDTQTGDAPGQVARRPARAAEIEGLALPDPRGDGSTRSGAAAIAVRQQGPLHLEQRLQR